MDIKDEIIDTVQNIAQYQFDIKEDEKYCYFRVSERVADDLRDELSHLRLLLSKLESSNL